MVVLSGPGLDIFPVDTIFVEGSVESGLDLSESLSKPHSVLVPVVSLLGGGPLVVSVLLGGSHPDWVVVSLGHIGLELVDGNVLGVVGVHGSEKGSPFLVDGGAVSCLSGEGKNGSEE